MIPDSVEADYYRRLNDLSHVAAREYLRAEQLAYVADMASAPVGFDNVGDLFHVRPAVGTVSGATWATGDFNADRDVDRSQSVGFGNVGDLFVLLQNLGTNVRTIPSAPLTSLANELNSKFGSLCGHRISPDTGE
jgi:hypothetical protein